MLFGKRSREPEIKFDPDKQYAIIRSSICTGEKVAGFKNKDDGHFTEGSVLNDHTDRDAYGYPGFLP